jgi:antitoxin component YwqK of YwqJK toxin-antitoxin module
MYKNDLPNGVQIDYNKNGEKFLEVILEDGKVIEYIYPKKKRNT